MKLELKHLAPYLPYGLKCQFIEDMREDFGWQDWVGDIEIFNKGSIWTYGGYADPDLLIPLGEGDLSGFIIRNGNTYSSVGDSVKPILRPLSDLTKEIQIAEYYMTFKSHLKRIYPSETIGLNPATWSYRSVEWLLGYHFDVFGLIDKELAIDINTLNP